MTPRSFTPFFTAPPCYEGDVIEVRDARPNSGLRPGTVLRVQSVEKKKSPDGFEFAITATDTGTGRTAEVRWPDDTILRLPA